MKHVLLLFSDFNIIRKKPVWKAFILLEKEILILYHSKVFQMRLRDDLQ